MENKIISYLDKQSTDKLKSKSEYKNRRSYIENKSALRLVKSSYHDEMSAAPLVSAGREEFNMDEVTRELISRLDKDIRDHKQEIRDRDAAQRSDAQEREARYREEMQEQNRIFRQEAKEREERMEKMVAGLSSEIKDIRSEIKDIKSEVSQNTKHVQSLVTANIWGLVATIVAIAALVVTVILTR
ncbi:hypothetical protein [Paenibacillus rubinfantis]|uniref:hypothetical protein n=1 Tax=Paenibacillus rubinfantis TaxID=1720296 RepID=UPI00073F6C76|nr:hypothetical protein [Paenibacillus rubinfantis]